MTYKLVFLADNIRYIHVVGGWTKILELLASEDVDGNQVDFSVTVFASLGGAHFDNLAGTALNDDETILAEGRALHRIGGGSAGIGALKGVALMLFVKTSELAGLKLDPVPTWHFRRRKHNGAMRGGIPARHPPCCWMVGK